jgi:hypothetical protein
MRLVFKNVVPMYLVSLATTTTTTTTHHETDYQQRLREGLYSEDFVQATPPPALPPDADMLRWLACGRFLFFPLVFVCVCVWGRC